MNPEIEHILLKDSWTEEDRNAIRCACNEDPELAATLRRWIEVVQAVGESFRDDLPDVRSLVLSALSTWSSSSIFDETDRHEADEMRRSFQELSEKHPALPFILERIRADADLFDSCWAEHQSKPIKSTRNLQTVRVDRPAVSLVGSLPRAVRWTSGVAAVVAIVLFALIVGRSDYSSNGWKTIQTEPDEMHLLVLSDGSTVRLMGDSEITFRDFPAGSDRIVRVEGNAFFDVVHAQTPFRVQTNNSVTSVLGTQFGIATGANITHVTLVSGRVAIEAVDYPGETVYLMPGEAGRVIGDGPPEPAEIVDLDLALAWTKLFIFRETPLSRIILRLSDSFGVDIALEASLEEEVLSGTFSREQGLREILEVISAALDIQLEPASGDGPYRLLPRS